MKKLIAVFVLLAILFVLRPPSTSAQQGQATAFAQFGITNLHTVATNLLSTNLKVMRVTFIGLRSEGVSNVAAVYVGPTTNATPYIIYPGERHVIECQPNSFIFLNTWQLKTPTTSDGLVVIYQ